MNYRSDCLHFRGHLPCVPHKRDGVHCENCPQYVRREGRILLIKLGAAGDVIRTTPLLAPLRRDHPRHRLTWLTYFPELLPELVDEGLRFDAGSVLWVRNTSFDLVINLDKDREACALTREVQAARKFGFTLDENGICQPIEGPGDGPESGAARAKYLTGLFDDVNQAGRQSYLQEIFAICGYTWQGEPYLLDRPQPAPRFDLPAGQSTIGLNTGCGGRWTSRRWPEEHWAELARSLQAEGHVVVLLGGAEEDERNRRLAAATGATYPGHFDLRTFIGLVDRCDLVVSAVTMAMHIALGLGKQLVLLNNIFNRHEFELYGRGVIVEPEVKCGCFFQPTCSQEQFCLETLRPAAVQAAVQALRSGA